ncbi:hypothetical protein AB4Y64_09745 [Lysobacter sp. TAF61]|uniref:hypothetical protein n=1 Tax=Lysobacter sp. TAF61 TaxID=3233072 RepID=UPI003F95462F
MKAITKIALGVLATSIALLIILPSNPPGAANAPQGAADPSARADAPAESSAPPAAAQAQPAADPAALASETIGFLETSIEDLRRGLEARDAQGISDEIEWPAIRLIGRWQEVPTDLRQPYAACFEALDAMRILAGDLTGGADSLARRRSIEEGASTVDRSLSACRAGSERGHNSAG